MPHVSDHHDYEERGVPTVLANLQDYLFEHVNTSVAPPFALSLLEQILRLIPDTMAETMSQNSGITAEE